MRKTPALLSALAVAAVVMTSLAGCAADSSAYYASGSASSVVKVSGPSTKAATAKFPTPLVTKTSQLTVDKPGHGAPIQAGDQVDFEYAVFSGKTGELLGSSGYGASGSTAPRAAAVSQLAGKQTYAVVRSLQGAKTGERYTLVTTAKLGFGAGALTSNNIADNDTLVVVVDIKDHFIGKANGVNVLPQDGLPSVITSAGTGQGNNVDGQPGIVIQEQNVPTTLRIETVKAGGGAVVKKNATVRIKYTGWTWPASSSDKPTTWDEQTWDNDQAVDIAVKSTADGGSLPPGMYQAIVGAKVGSQVLAVIPPKEGFPAGNAPTGVDATSTLIMVIDVLSIK